MIRDRLKRAVDVALAIGAGCAVAPVLPVVAIAIRIDSRGDVLFRHSRLGRFGREIVLTKFRTMHATAGEVFNPDGSRKVASRDGRITRVGRFLRGGLDELPQLLAVLRGELSFVGPRPDDLYAVDLYQDAEWLKLSVRPGITGLAAVSGRNDLPWRSRVVYDIYYAKHRSLWLDLRIVVKTLAMALRLTEPGGVVSFDEARAFARSDEARREGRAIEEQVRAYIATLPPDPRYSLGEREVIRDEPA